MPFVSVIIPCRNEERFIARCLDSVVAQDYPKNKMEVLVVNGMSEDGTRKIVKRYAKQYSFIKIFDNPKTITSPALNSGIKNAKGELILWMSAHNRYEREYISKCVKYMQEFDAVAVGGIIKIIPRNNSFVGKSICLVLSCSFGVGSSIHKIGTLKPRWVDTAFGTCYRKEVFNRVGLFNEQLVRGQDMEFSIRLKKAGLRTLLVPDVVSYYYARSDFKSFCRHNFRNGVWAILPLEFTTIMPVSWRHLVPLAFVSGLVSSLGLWGLWSSLGLMSFLLIIGSYSICNLFLSIKIALREKDWRYLFIMPVVFASLHICYGFGSMVGLVRVLFSKNFWKMRFKYK
ncbi:MAG: glycosyltransferase family 2 protein [Candidatus Edwardsbacteria bacterium]